MFVVAANQLVIAVCDGSTGAASIMASQIRRNGTPAPFVRRNGIRRNGIRRNGYKLQMLARVLY